MKASRCSDEQVRRKRLVIDVDDVAVDLDLSSLDTAPLPLLPEMA